MSGLLERCREPLPEGMCGQSMGCNAASVCLCLAIEDQREDLAAAATIIDAMTEALNQIAAFDDKHASGMLGLTGSYGLFDEPGSVQIARECLARITPLLSGSQSQ